MKERLEYENMYDQLFNLHNGGIVKDNIQLDGGGGVVIHVIDGRLLTFVYNKKDLMVRSEYFVRHFPMDTICGVGVINGFVKVETIQGEDWEIIL